MAERAERPLRHLVLVGPPGVGKSSIGRRVARLLRLPFVDLDQEISATAGLTIERIFDELGEERFRLLERQVTVRLREAPPSVVATGGGWAANPGASELLDPAARIIYLRASPSTLLVRLGRGRARRPLLRGEDPIGTLAALLEQREQWYRRAHAVLETDDMDPEQAALAVAALAEAGAGHSGR